MIENILKVIFIISFIIIIFLLIIIFIQKKQHDLQGKRVIQAREYFFQVIKNQKPTKKLISEKLYLEAIVDLEDQIILDIEERRRLLKGIPAQKIKRKYLRHLKSFSTYKRIVAATKLGFFNDEEVKQTLIKRLLIEKNISVKFYISYALFQNIDQKTFDRIIYSTIGEYYLYVKNIAILTNHFYSEVKDYLPSYFNSDKIEVVHNLAYIAKRQIDFNASTFVNKNLPLYISYSKDPSDLFIATRVAILQALQLRNSKILKGKIILNASDFNVRKFGYEALAKTKDFKDIKYLLDQLTGDVNQDNYIIQVISDEIESSINFFKLLDLFDNLQRPCQKSGLAKILSAKIEFIILRLQTEDRNLFIRMLELIVEQNYSAGIIAFINANKDLKIEQELFAILKLQMIKNLKFKKDLLIYIKPDILSRNGYLAEKPVIVKKEPAPLEKSKIRWILLTFLITVLIFPFISLVSQRKTILSKSFIEIFKQFILDTNYNLIWYFIIANFIYLVLLVISLNGAKKQNHLWAIKTERLLYIEDLLPPISIIAPAYNEEANIISSVQSLLNLKYPSYEVVVVNDGSKDNTLAKLIEHFNLKRKNPSFAQPLGTKEVRGVYTCKAIPNLVVVNKANGGKADALNVGINVSKNPYICGIDADSVLEQSALLRLISVTLDNSKIPIALGGNIIPANGCIIDHGHIVDKALPKETLTKLQALEYLRAFTSGRIGWSSINSLLIISGAFGLFRKKDIISVGGYITSSGELKKDSVGEDMELVVRLTNQKIKDKENYLVSYIYHANCYTELPGDMKTLLKQRNRWHRGLIDILSYHRKMQLNIKYKQIGLIAFPYFYIFEVMGPFIEMFGYLALIVSFIFGFLAIEIVLGIFFASVIMGTIISLTSLYIAEEVTQYTKKKDVFSLIFYSIFENFGYRQLVAMHRVYSFFTALKETGAWGEQKRKGFSKTK